MPQLDRYLLRMFCVRFVLAVIALVSLYLAIDLIEKMRWVTREDLPLARYLLFFWYRVPLAVSHVLPLSALLAATLTVATLSRRHELTALRAAGIAPARVLVPLVAGGLLCGLTLWAVTEHWLPEAHAAGAAIEREALKRRWQPPGSQTRWYAQGPYRLRVGAMTPPDRLEDIELLTLADTGVPREHLRAESARWDGAAWRIETGERWRFEEAGAAHTTTGQVSLPVRLPPAALGPSILAPERLRFAELEEAVQSGEAGGQDVRALGTALDLRILLPLSCLLLSLLGAPFGTGPGITTLSGALARALAIGTLYLTVSAAGALLEQRGAGPAWLLIWTPQLAWAAAGIHRLRHLR